VGSVFGGGDVFGRGRCVVGCSSSSSRH
jgi:hypothetical protein